MYHDTKIAVVVTAGGRGRRMGAPVPKQFLRISGRTILETAVDRFLTLDWVDQILITAPPDAVEETKALFEAGPSGPCGDPEGALGRLTIIPGGKERQDSVRNALEVLRRASFPEDGLVLVHDGVRPYVTEAAILRCRDAALADGAAICAAPVTETIRDRERGTLDRARLVRVQTPQGFRFGLLWRAFERARAEGFLGTDEAGLVERTGILPVLVDAGPGNVKITTPEDLRKEMRVGTGFDVHRLVGGRKLILGGVEVPFDRGLLGHSDADVLTHAVMDALLGAAALGDIGKLFPDSDPAYEGADSTALLRTVGERLRAAGFTPGNVDATLICQRPKLMPHIPAMRENLAAALDLPLDRVSVKATTTERLGFTGREEGIAAEAVCTVEETV